MTGLTLAQHEHALAELLRIPQPNWEARGSIEFHRDAIRILTPKATGWPRRDPDGAGTR